MDGSWIAQTQYQNKNKNDNISVTYLYVLFFDDGFFLLNRFFEDYFSG